MSDVALHDGDDGWRLTGELTFDTTRRALEGPGEQLAAGGPARVDLSGVTRVDSAGLAVLIDWLASARSAGRSLEFVSPPDQLRALARVSGVDTLLGFATAEGSA